MNVIIDKIKNFVGIEDEDYEEVGLEGLAEEEEEEEEEKPKYQEQQNYQSNPARKKQPAMEQSNNSKVVGLHERLANSIAEVVIIEPHSFEEMPQVIQTLRERRSVVLNLNIMDPDEAQRAVDFVAGGTYAMDGHQERIGESIFLFTPSCVKVSTLSGIVHDVQEAPAKPQRKANPTPSWSVESTRMAQ